MLLQPLCCIANSDIDSSGNTRVTIGIEQKRVRSFNDLVFVVFERPKTLGAQVPGRFEVVRVKLGRVKRIWYLSPIRATKVQASLRIRAVSPQPPLLAHINSESRGTFRQKARSLAPLNVWACAVTICHDGMLEDTNSLDAAQL